MSGEKDPKVVAAEKKAEGYASADSAVETITTVGRYGAMAMMAASNILGSMNSMIAKEAGQDLEKKCLAEIDAAAPGLPPTEEPPPDWDALLKEGYVTCVSPLAAKILKFAGHGEGRNCEYAHKCASMEKDTAGACKGYQAAIPAIAPTKDNPEGFKAIPEEKGECTEPDEWDKIGDTLELVEMIVSPRGIHECVAPKIDKIINIVPVQYYIMKILAFMLGKLGASLANVTNAQGKLVEQIKCGGQLEQLINKKSVDLADPFDFSFEIPAIPYFKIPCTGPIDCSMRIIETLIIEVICLVFCVLIEKLLNWIAQAIYWMEKEYLSDLLDYNPAKFETGTFLGDKTLNAPKLTKVNPIKYIPSSTFEEAWVRKHVSTSISKERARVLIKAYLNAAFESTELEQRDIVMLFMGESTCGALAILKGLTAESADGVVTKLAEELNLTSESAIMEFWEFLGGYLDMLTYLEKSAPPDCPPEVCEITEDISDKTFDAIKDLCDLLDPNFNILEHIPLGKVVSTAVGPQIRSGMGQHIGILENRIEEFILLKNKSEKEPYLKENVSEWRFLRHIYDYRFKGSKEEHGLPRTIERGYLNTHHFLSVHRSGHPADFYEESFDPSHHKPSFMVYEPGPGFKREHGDNWETKWEEASTEKDLNYAEPHGAIKCRPREHTFAREQENFSWQGTRCRGYPAYAAELRGEEWWLDVDGSFYIKYLKGFGDGKHAYTRAVPQAKVRSDWAPDAAAGPTVYTGEDASTNEYSLHLKPVAMKPPFPGATWEEFEAASFKTSPFIKVKHANISTDFWKFRPLKKVVSIVDDTIHYLHVPWLETSDDDSHAFQAANWSTEVGDVAAADVCKGNTALLRCSVAKREDIDPLDLEALAVPNPFHMVDLRRRFLKGFLPFLSPEYYSPEEQKGLDTVQFFTDGLFGFDSAESSSNNYWHERISPKSMPSRYGDAEIKKFTGIYEEHSKVDDIKFVGLMSQLQRAALEEAGVIDTKDQSEPPLIGGPCQYSDQCDPGFGCMLLSDGGKKCVYGYVNEDEKYPDPGQVPNCWKCNSSTNYSTECKSGKCQSIDSMPDGWVAGEKKDYTGGYTNYSVCIGVGADCDECGNYGDCCMSDNHCKGAGKCVKLDYPGLFSHVCVPPPDPLFPTPEDVALGWQGPCKPDDDTGQKPYGCPCYFKPGLGGDSTKCLPNLKCVDTPVGWRCGKKDDTLWKDIPGITYDTCFDKCLGKVACIEKNGCDKLPGAPKVKCQEGFTYGKKGLSPCKKCTKCKSYQKAAEPCTASADTKCVDKKTVCKPGYFSNTGFVEPGVTKCYPCKECDPDTEIETHPCEPDYPRECAKKPPEKEKIKDCVSGTFSKTGKEPCKKCKVCKDHQKISNQCTTTNNTVCKDQGKGKGMKCAWQKDDKGNLYHDCAPGFQCKSGGMVGDTCQKSK